MRLIPFLFLLFCFRTIFAQDSKQPALSSKEITGLWHINSPLVGDAYQKIFRFYKNGEFAINHSQYDDIARIKRINGKYSVADSSLFLEIETRTELIGGKLVQGNQGFQSEEFVLFDAKPVVIKQIGEKTEDYPIKRCKSKNGAKCIQVGNNKYYKFL